LKSHARCKDVRVLLAQNPNIRPVPFIVLSQFLRHEQITDPSPWVDQATTKRVREAIDEVGGERLTPIFEQLGGEVPYDEIRIVANCLANVEG